MKKVSSATKKGAINESIIKKLREDSEYQNFFKGELEKVGKSIPSMSDEEKKAFFNKIDADWNAKGEKSEMSESAKSKLRQIIKEEIQKLNEDTEFKKGDKIKVIGTQYKGATGIIISNDMQNGQYLCQTTAGGIKGFYPNDIMRVWDYDKWAQTRTQAKNIFRMLKQKYNNKISDMKDGLELILKQNKTKDDQAEVVRDEFNKYFKIK